MSTIDQVKSLVIQGYSLGDVVQALPRHKYSTLKTYLARVNGQLTDAEKQRRDAARAARPRKRPDYHRKYQDRTVLGPVHLRIGRKLLMARLELNMKSEEFCDRNDFANRAVLSLMEQGYHDFTVSEVQVVADIVGTTVEELLTAATLPEPDNYMDTHT